MIEGLYAIDRGTTQLLVERGLHEDLISHGASDAPPSQIVAYLRDQAEVYDWLFDLIAKRRPLSTSYIKQLHQLLTRNQSTTEAIDQFEKRIEVPLRRGEWKELPNNPRRPDGTTHEYCPPEHVAAEMDRLLDWHLEHSDAGIAPEVEAAWLHHRFTQIHPFQDGNGRVARAISSLVLLRAERFAFSVTPDEKGTYIDALENADAGDLTTLVGFIERGQQREFGQALSVAQELVDEQEIFAAAMSKAAVTYEGRVAAYVHVKQLGNAVMDTVRTELTERRADFTTRLDAEHLGDAYRAHVFSPPANMKHYYFAEIVECANKLDYFADTREYRDWVRFAINHEHEDRITQLVVSLHSFGRTFKGVLAAIAFVEVLDNEDSGLKRSGPQLATDAALTFGYLDPEEHVKTRMRDWLQVAWLSLLRTWQEAM
jgi:Fic family protein